jgi:parallel beta-helix repeat protein
MSIRNAGEFPTIQAAINDLPATGGIVFIPEGTYTEDLTIPHSNITLWGSGKGTKIITTANTAAAYIEKLTGVAIKNIYFYGSGTGNTNHGVYFRDECTNCAVENCWFENFGSSGVRMYDACDHNRVSNNYFTGCVTYGIWLSLDCSYNTISDNQLLDNGTTTNKFGIFVTYQSHYNAIVGNTINNSWIGIHIHLGSDYPNACKYNTISGNTIYNCDYGIYINGCHYNSVVGNTITGGGEVGSQINVDAGLGNSIVGNTCTGGATMGILIQGPSAAHKSTNNTISGNTVSSNTQHGIWIATADDNTIIGNTVTDNDVNNTATYNGICVSHDSDNNAVVGNRCRDNDLYEIRVTHGAGSGANECANNSIIGNTVIGSDHQGTILDSGTNTEVDHNVGYVTENSGTGTILSGTTSIVITHGLSFTPTLENIFITLGELSTTDPGQIYVTTITSTQFTVNCRTNPGASNLDFAWRAQR